MKEEEDQEFQIILSNRVIFKATPQISKPMVEWLWRLWQEGPWDPGVREQAGQHSRDKLWGKQPVLKAKQKSFHLNPLCPTHPHQKRKEEHDGKLMSSLQRVNRLARRKGRTILGAESKVGGSVQEV